MTEADEQIEEVEVRTVEDNNALIRLLEKRIDAIKKNVNFDALKYAPKARREAIQDYVKRLEQKYYAALQRKTLGA